MTSGPQENWLLGDVKDWLRDRVDGGAKCPCCTQYAKVYRRRINGTMVRTLANLYHHGIDDNFFGHWVHLPPIDPSHGEAARLRYWGLMEEEVELRDDGGRSGWWRITQEGIEWLHGRMSVQEYALVYDSKLLRLDGGPWWVHDAVKDKFDLQELMQR